MGNSAQYVGIDVASEWLDVWLHPARIYKRFTNDVGGISALLKHLALVEGGIVKAVLEATGGLEYQAARRMQKAGIAVAVVNPYFTSAFRVMRGKRTKTDATDAEMLAMFAEKMDPEVRPVPTAQEKEMRELTARRVQLIEMVTAEKNRLRRIDCEPVKLSVRLMIDLLSEEKQRIEQRLQKMVAEHEAYATQYRLLTSIPAIGPAVAITLITELPELGQLNKKEIASLVGLVPHNRDSGKSVGKASIRTGGGRRCVKAALYMGALVAARRNPTLAAFYKRLVESGKPKKVAIVATMRKLLITANQMIKEQREWSPDYQHA